MCEADKHGKVTNIVSQTVGSGVWYSVDGVVLTAYHVVKPIIDRVVHFYLYDRDELVWLTMPMRVSCADDVHVRDRMVLMDVAVLEKDGPLTAVGTGHPTEYKPLLLSSSGLARVGTDVWHLGFPAIADKTLAERRNLAKSQEEKAAQRERQARTVNARAQTPPPPRSLASSSSTVDRRSEQLTSRPQEVADEKAEKVDQATTAPEADGEYTAPIIVPGAVCKVSYDNSVYLADYISALNGSGGAVVAHDEEGWSLVGIHIGVIHHDIDFTKKPKPRNQIVQASGTSQFAEIISMIELRALVALALKPNVEKSNTDNHRRSRLITQSEQPTGSRKRKSATAHSAAAAATAAPTDTASDVDESDGCSEEDEGEDSASENWCQYYDRRVSRAPLDVRRYSAPSLPAQPPAQSNSSNRQTQSL